MIETPQSFSLREECRKAATTGGYRLRLGQADGWAGFRSTTVNGRIWLAATGMEGPWFLAVELPGAAQGLKFPTADLHGPGFARYAFPKIRELYVALSVAYKLSLLLPPPAFEVFQEKTKALPKTTEAERLIVQRIGQDLFRQSLMAWWGGCCPLTGIVEPALLRASHIVPWSECVDDAERLDPMNGLLLSALWDAAFDRALVTFDDEGAPLFSAALDEAARKALIWDAPITLTDAHRAKLVHHRQRFAFKNLKTSEGEQFGTASPS